MQRVWLGSRCHLQHSGEVTKKVVFKKFPNLNLDFLNTEQDKVEDTQGDTVDFGPEGKRVEDTDGAEDDRLKEGDEVQAEVPQPNI